MVYIQWGRTICPNNTGSVLVYNGITAASTHKKHGGGANYLCLPHIPEYLSKSPQYFSTIAATEYSDSTFGSLDRHDAPCAVCYTSTKAVQVMIPAKTTCPSSWTIEYVGYLMAAYETNNRNAIYECVDKDPEAIPGSAVVYIESVFHFVKATCTGIPCPPYNTKKALTCVVCTK